jgi:hypothetical protein
MPCGIIGGMPTDDVHDDLAGRLRRWQDSGAVWQVLHRDAGTVTVAMLTCDGGEEMERATSDDPAVLAFIGSRRRSDE